MTSKKLKKLKTFMKVFTYIYLTFVGYSVINLIVCEEGKEKGAILALLTGLCILFVNLYVQRKVVHMYNETLRDERWSQDKNKFNA